MCLVVTPSESMRPNCSSPILCSRWVCQWYMFRRWAGRAAAACVDHVPARWLPPSPPSLSSCSSSSLDVAIGVYRLMTSSTEIANATPLAPTPVLLVFLENWVRHTTVPVCPKNTWDSSFLFNSPKTSHNSIQLWKSIVPSFNTVKDSPQFRLASRLFPLSFLGCPADIAGKLRSYKLVETCLKKRGGIIEHVI